MVPFVLVAVSAAVVTAITTSLLLRFSKTSQIAPEIRDRDVHATPTPRLGGVAMFFGILVALAFASTRPQLASVFAEPRLVWALVAACFIIAVIGVLDDLFDLDWMLKLAAQLLASGVLAWNGAQIVSLPLGDTLVIASPALNFALTVFLMTLVMNAVNFVDGLDGLVAGVAIIANLAFFIYTELLILQTGSNSAILLAALIAAIVVGISAGFMPFNWHRAKMFMGDTGALLIGLLMATSTVTVTGQLNPAQLDQKLVLASFIPIILPVAVLIVPLLDFTLAVFRRLRAGQSPFAADRKHLHHRLLDMGHSQVQAVIIFYLWTAMISLAFLLVFITQSYFWPAIVAISGGALSLIVTLAPAVWVRDWLAQRGLIRLSMSSKRHAAEERATIV